MTGTPRLVLDQGCPASAAALLRDTGWDVVHLGGLGMTRATDAAILDWAKQEQRIVVTLDADFHTPPALAQSAGPSVIRIRREGLNGAALATLLRQAWPAMASALAAGAAVTITDSAIRFRHLPIGSTT